jgi:hypothetical protein
MSFLITFLRVVLILFVLRLIVRGVAALFRPSRAASKAQPPRMGGALVRDKVCNTFLPRERAIRTVVDGREEFFCSDKCRKRAQAGVARAS